MSSKLIGMNDLAYQVKIHRDHLSFSQDELAKKIGPSVTRSNIAHLEQGLRVPEKDRLKLICESINLPNELWHPFLNDISIFRLNFEIQLSEFTGHNTSTKDLDFNIELV
ncbi:MAG: helix-turn-helix domain-containing protein [Flavobacteriaceae bacterium]|nr:MAG: helix-turn-helix domain-containing protein [Flavobacteriaceae bacterium]